MSKAEERANERYCIIRDDDTEETSGIDMQRALDFIDGYHQAEKDVIDNLWHDPDEEPEIDRKIIWESENFLGKHLDKEWKPKIDCFGRKERWCYLADILPSRNWTGERPYSKVDYSRGYEQAEKDNELTWENMFDIFRLVNAVLDDYAEGKTRKEIGEEVLRRFKISNKK